MFGIVDKISGPIICKGEGVDDKLKENGFAISDVKSVFISHMDFDHTSGLRLVKDVQDIRTAEEEWIACNKRSFRYIDTWSGICDVGTFRYTKSGIGPVGESYDVFEDGKVLLVHTPGHSNGHFSVMVRGDDGYIVLGDDAAYLPESFEKQIIPGFTTDKTLAKKSLEWLTACRNDTNCKGVFVNHDPTVEEQIVEV